jgi:hypothetical protein
MVGNPLKPAVGLDNLLNLDGEIFPMDNGYWAKFEARRVPASPQMTHGIRYSLTLHDRNNTRVIGYDNAHAVKPHAKSSARSRQLRTMPTARTRLSRMNSSRQSSCLKTSGTKRTDL